MTEQQNELRRSKRKRAFTQVDNEIVNNSALSFQAKGMLLYLLSKKDGWKFYEDDLVNRSSNGKTSVRSIIKELLDVGYLIRGERFRDEKGHLKGYSYIVEPYLLDDYDGTSYITFSKVGKSNLGNPYLGESQRSNTKSFSNTKSSSNTEEREKEEENQETPPSPVIDKNFQTLQTFFDEHIGKRNFTTDQELSSLLDDFKDPLLIGEALKIAAKNGKPLFTYGAGVLRKLAEEKGVTTHEQFKQRAEQKKQASNLADRAKNKPTEFGGHILPF
ncbi:DnaD domain protein [Kurthia populi]|uniref:DnaD domain protein n=1 Tax=Kurthia populi TaxID=1562132 RepID=A0ABW5XX79_9BACL